jgi:hypothetical protein
MTTITTHLIGGLGNQMFQYAAARALALRTGAAVELDITGFETYGLRRYELDTFAIVAATSTVGPPVSPVEPVAATGMRDRIDRLLGRGAPMPPPGTITHYREAHFHFDPDLAKQPLPLYMDGYWQSERYFADAATQIRTELTPIAPLEPENAATAAAIDRVTAVSVHVRRGDYVSNAHTNSYHGTCSLDYYQSAINLVRSQVEHPHLFVFTDDQAWTRANLISDLPATYVSANPADRGFRDMQLMSRCRHHIIANSSFSWWGAWLNPRLDKIVVAPVKWFAASTNSTRDLVPKEWRRT